MNAPFRTTVSDVIGILDTMRIAALPEAEPMVFVSSARHRDGVKERTILWGGQYWIATESDFEAISNGESPEDLGMYPQEPAI